MIIRKKMRKKVMSQEEEKEFNRRLAKITHYK